MAEGFEARVLICSECGEEFVFTVEAQQYFAERGYSEDPKRCKTCHTKYKKLQREQQDFTAAAVKSNDRYD
jgi:hypothetical protein